MDSNNEHRTIQIKLRLTPSEKAELERRAQAAHLDVSSYLRFMAFK